MLASRAASSRLGVALGRDGADERVARDPVGARGEDRHAVSTKRKKRVPRLVGVGRLVERRACECRPRARCVESVVVASSSVDASGRSSAGSPRSWVHHRRGWSTLRYAVPSSARPSPSSDARRRCAVPAVRRGRADPRRQRRVAGESLGLDAHGDQRAAVVGREVERRRSGRRPARRGARGAARPAARCRSSAAADPSPSRSRTGPCASRVRSGVAAPTALSGLAGDASSGGSKRIASSSSLPGAAGAVTSKTAGRNMLRVLAELARRSATRVANVSSPWNTSSQRARRRPTASGGRRSARRYHHSRSSIQAQAVSLRS